MDNSTESGKAQAKVKITLKQKLAWMIRLQADDKMSVTAKLVGIRLALFHHEESGRCNPRQGVIAKAVGLELRTVNRALAQLKDAGWIGISEKSRGASHYTLNISETDRVEVDETRPDRRIKYVSGGASDTSGGAYLIRLGRRTEPCSEPSSGTMLVKPAPAGADQPAEKVGEAAASRPAAAILAPENDNQPDHAFHGRSLDMPDGIVRTLRLDMPALDIKSHLNDLDSKVPDTLAYGDKILWAVRELRTRNQVVLDAKKRAS